MQTQPQLPPANARPQRRAVTQKNTNNAHAFFIEGYDIPLEEQMLRDKLLAICPTLKTKSYRDSLLKIISSLTGLDHFSENLERKVDGLLQTQENHFVESYKHHIEHIRDEFESMQKQIKQLHDKVRYYENEGKMSALVKKVFQLEQESSKLYRVINEKEARIKQLELDLKVQNKEIVSMESTLKTNARQKSESIWKEIKSQVALQSATSPQKVNEFSLFPTQPLKRGSSIQHHPKATLTEASQCSPRNPPPTQPRNLHSITCELSPQPMPSIDKVEPSSTKKKHSMLEGKLREQNARLKNRNKKLLSFQTRVMDSQNQLEHFFVSAVEELKREIKLRKKIEYCSLQDFKKEDKLTLMIKILSNDDVVAYLHQRLFRKSQAYLSQGATDELKQDDRDNSGRLPALKFHMSYHPAS